MAVSVGTGPAQGTDAAEAPVLPATLEEALLAAQAAVGELVLTRDGLGKVEGQNKAGKRFSYDYRYLTYGKLLDALRPILNASGLVWQTFPTTLDGKPALKYRLVHAPSREAVEDTVLLMMDKQTSQAQGSAITYARRYALMAVLEISPDEDDDGAAASQPPRPAPADPEAALSQDALDRMAEAIDELEVNRDDLLSSIGVAPGAELTVSDGRKVSERLARIREARAGGEGS